MCKTVIVKWKRKCQQWPSIMFKKINQHFFLPMVYNDFKEFVLLQVTDL